MAESLGANYGGSRRYVDRQSLQAWLDAADPYIATMPVEDVGVAPKKPREREATDRPKGPLGLGTVGEAGGEVWRNVTEGVKAVTSPTGEGFFQRLGQRTMGALQTAFPFGAFGGHIYGRVFEELSKSSGELTDEKLKARIAFAKKHAPGEAPIYEALIDTPEGQRVDAVYEGARLGGEAVFGMIPGYTGLAKGAARVLGQGKGLTRAAELAARGAGGITPEALETIPRGPAETPLRTAAEVAGAETRAPREAAGDPLLLERQNTPMRPGEPAQPTALIVDDLGRAVEAPVRSPEELAATRREALRATNKTPLDAPPRAPAPEAAPAIADPGGELTTAGQRAMARAETALAEDVAKLEDVQRAATERQAAARERALAETPEEGPPRGATEGERAPVETTGPAKGPGAPVTDAERAAVEAEQQALRQEWGDLKKRLSDQTGAGQVGFLVRTAIGGLAGAAAPADTPEDRMRNALIGTGVGAALSKQTARTVATVLKNEIGGWDLDKLFARKRAAPTAEGAPSVQPNYARIEAEGDLKRLMQNVHAQMADRITTAMRAPTTHRETTFEAARLLEKGDVSVQSILEGAPVDIDTLPAWSKAARDINVGVANEALDVAKRMLAGEVLPPGELRRALAVSGEISQRVRVAQTRFGQTLSAQKIGAVPAEALTRPRIDAERLARMGDEIAPGLDDMELAAMVTKLERPAQVIKATEYLSVMPRALLEAMYFSMLGGKAIARNIVGNLIVMPLSIVVRGVAAYMPGGGAQGVMRGEAAQMAVGWWEGVAEQWQMIRHWDTAKWRAQLEAAAGGMFGESQRIGGIHAPAITAENFGLESSSAAGIFVDWTGRAMRLPMDILSGTDSVSKALNGRMQHRVEAFRQATFEGRTGENFWNRVDVLLNDVKELNAGAVLRIEEFKERQTFTKPFENRFLLAAQNPTDSEWGNYLYRGTIMPFFRTPVRIAEYTLEHTPLLNALAASTRADFKAGGAARQVAIAKAVTGASLIGLFMYMEGQGLITGSAPRDSQLRKTWEQAGWQEKSFWDPVNEKWRSYDGLEPFTTLIAMGADIGSAARKLPDRDIPHLFAAGVLSMLNNLDSKTYTQGISEVLAIIKAPGTDAQVEKAMEWTRKRLGLIPVVGTIPQVLGGATVKEIRDVVDPTRRRVIESGGIENPVMREVQAAIDYYRNRIPGLSSARDENGEFLVPPIRNSITGEVAMVENFPFLPFPGRTPKTDPVFNEILRLDGAGLRELPTYIGAAEAANVGLTPAKGRPGVQLTPQEADRWVVLMTQEVRNGAGETYHQALTSAITSPVYGEQAPRTQAEYLKSIEGEFKARAQKELLREYPKLAALFTERQIDYAVGGAPPAQQETIRQTLRGAAGLSLGR